MPPSLVVLFSGVYQTESDDGLNPTKEIIGTSIAGQYRIIAVAILVTWVQFFKPSTWCWEGSEIMLLPNTL